MARGKYEARNPAVLAFIKWLDDCPYLQHLAWYSRFRAVIELWFAAVRRDDKVYLERVKELTPAAVRGCEQPGPGTKDSACGHFAELWRAMLEEPQDLLGEAYQAYSVRDTKRLAQYFTPDNVAQCMAEMTVGDIPAEVFAKPGGCRLGEPCCGSGVMMIHCIAAICRKHGEWGVRRTQVVMCDLDPICVAMAAVQMAWLPWRVGTLVMLQGDSLSGEEKQVAWITGQQVNFPGYERIIRKAEPEVPIVIKEDTNA